MSTPNETIERHRRNGRGRKAAWVALGATALVAVTWFAQPIAGRGRAHFVVVMAPRCEVNLHSPTSLASYVSTVSGWPVRGHLRAGGTTRRPPRAAQPGA